jgi:hypothetical protein
MIRWLWAGLALLGVVATQSRATPPEYPAPAQFPSRSYINLGLAPDGAYAALLLDSNHYLQVNCVVGCSGGGAVTQGAGSSSNPWWVQGLGAVDAPAGGVISVQAPASTPAAGTASAITTGGSANNLITGPVNGCYITNPLLASDQNIATAEVAYVNGVTTATANGRGTNSALQPGQSWACVPGQSTNVSGIAATSGHALSVVKW